MASPVVTAQEVAEVVDVVFITHEHGDHFQEETVRIVGERSGCLFVVPANCVAKAKSAGIPEGRLVVARPGAMLDVKGLKVEALHAFHGYRGQTVYRGANAEDCGYGVTMAGRRLVQPGDSLLTQEQMELKDVDVLFVSPTVHNMEVDPAARWIRALCPGWIFPQHFGTYRTTKENDFWTVGFPDELGAALDGELRARYHKLRQGEVFWVEGA